MASTTAALRRLRHPEAIAVAGLIAVAWGVRIVIGAEVPSPSVYIDELVHAELARNLLTGLHDDAPNAPERRFASARRHRHPPPVRGRTQVRVLHCADMDTCVKTKATPPCVPLAASS